MRQQHLYGNLRRACVFGNDGEKAQEEELPPNESKVGNVTRFIKRFRIFKKIYRNEREKFERRFNLVSGVDNFESA